MSSSKRAKRRRRWKQFREQQKTGKYLYRQEETWEECMYRIIGSAKRGGDE